jgi:hypothetical protein
MSDHPEGMGHESGLNERPRRTRAQKSVPPPDAGAVQAPDRVPYVPLGVRGDYLFLLDAGGVFRAHRCKDLNRPTLISIFGTDASSIFDLYPTNWEQNKTTGRWEPVVSLKSFNYYLAVRDTVQRCRDAGIFDPEIQLRGRGAWLGRSDKGEHLVLHLGDHLIVGGKRKSLTSLSGFGYARAPTLRGLSQLPVSGSEAAGDWLIQLFGRWHWQYKRLAPLLLTGAIAGAMLSGALPMRPALAIGGGVLCGKRQLLRAVRRVLGPFVIIAHEADESHISQVVGWDSLAVLIDPPVDALSAKPLRPPRPPTWVAETAAVRMRPYDGMRFCTDETANQLGLGDRPHFLELTLGGRPDTRPSAISEDDCRARRPLVLRRMADQFVQLKQTVFPAWLELLEVQEGATELVRTIALLLACAWVLQRDDEPQERNFDALQPELDQLMGMEHEWRRPAWLQVLDCVRRVPVRLSSSSQTTLLEKIGIAAGVVLDGETPTLDQGGRWTEAQAIEHARRDPQARQAHHLIGQFGIRVLDDLPEVLRTGGDPGGYRCVAIAISAPMRDAELDRMTNWQQLVRQGMNIRMLLQHPKVRSLRSTVHFSVIGSCHCLVMPLDLVLGGLASEDPEGIADAWRKAET